MRTQQESPHTGQLETVGTEVLVDGRKQEWVGRRGEGKRHDTEHGGGRNEREFLSLKKSPVATPVACSAMG